MNIHEAAMPSFEEFFAACWDSKRPFPWQSELAKRVSEGGWPALLDVPTGLGKTAALDVFVWHLASQARLPNEARTAATRAAFVIDRRLVVDSAFRRMRNLTQTLQTSTEASLVGVASRLRSIGETQFPLVVQRMRGGITWESQWVRQPDQPAIVCGTVDQIGSRLLSRGYGSSTSRMPIDAGLLGVDCLVLIDEAHLSSAMAVTVRGVDALESTASLSPLRRRSGGVVKMTATSPDLEADVLKVGPDSADLDDAVAGRRLTADKRVALLEVRNDDEVTAAMAGLASLMVDGTRSVVLVVCNTVRRARKIFDSLEGSSSYDRQLLIGRCRPLERRLAEPDWFDRAAAGRDRTSAIRPLILVSTQTVEVGVDLDVDSLITEIASADALVQRFGRVDRLGDVGTTFSAVVGCTSKLDEAPVYGPSAKATWAMLSEATTATAWKPPKKSDRESGRRSLAAGPTFDAGPLAFRELIDATPDRRSLFASSAPAPVVVRPTLECWARTSPIPEPDEAIGPYLHGVERMSPVVSMAWRAGDTADALEASLQMTPLRSDELIEVPLLAARHFLFSPQEDGGGLLSDLEAQSTDESAVIRVREAAIAVMGVIVRSRRDIVHDLRMIRPGDIVVVPSELGGHDDGGWTGRSGRPVADVADLVDRRFVRVRLSTSVLRSFGITRTAVASALNDLRALRVDADPTPVVHHFIDELRSWFMADQSVEPGDDNEESDAKEVTLAARAFADDLELLRSSDVWSISEKPSDRGAVVIAVPRNDDGESGEGEDTVCGLALCMPRPLTAEDAPASFIETGSLADTDDEGENGEGSSLLAVIQPEADLSLRTHLHDVGERARHFAQRLGLGQDLTQTLAFAGFLHDLGKAEVRFQAMLRGGDVLAAESSAGQFAELLAKSDTVITDVLALRLATRRSRWPGLRHEAISLALAKTWPADEIPEAVDLDLALYLVATHHGYGRPWFPADREDESPTVITLSLDTVDIPEFAKRNGGRQVDLTASSADGVMAFDQPERCRRLRRRYGFWGLSFLEAVLRLADLSISEELGDRILAERAR